MNAGIRRWAVPAAALLALVFSAGFLAGRSSVPYAVAAAANRPPERAAVTQQAGAEQPEPDTEPAETQEPSAQDAAEKVNINTADVETLQTLPGIGGVLAERIIEYRTVSGGFADIEQLMEVSGIGEQKFAELRDYITVEDMK